MPKKSNTVRLQINISIQEKLDEALIAICQQKYLTKREAIKWAIIEFVNSNSLAQVKQPVTNGKVVRV